MKKISDTSWEKQDAEWKREKRKILNSMLAPSGAFIELPKPWTMIKTRPSTVAPGLSVEESIYAAQMIEYNQAIRHSLHRPNLINSFVNAANEMRDAVSLPQTPQIIKIMAISES